MTPEKLNRLWLLATGVIILVIIAGGIIIFLKRDSGQPLTVIPPEEPQYSGQVYVDGAVTHPGVYDFNPRDSLSSLIEASGGAQPDADLQALQLHIPSTITSDAVQQVDINRAPLWLLQALPGIGEIKAQAIVDYRRRIGRFENIEQLTSVPGISQSVFDKIKDYITTGD